MNATLTQPGIVDRDGREYDHRQGAPLYRLLLIPALLLAFLSLTVGNERDATLLLALSGVMGLFAFSFQWLEVRDQGRYLGVRYGPIPLFGKRFRYAEIMAAQPDRTSFIDGWGIHWVPGRGWTYNLWGFDCVRLTLKNGRTVRIGTDDPEGLAAFLQQRLSESL